MNQLIITVLGGLAVVSIASLMGISDKVNITVRGGKVRKTGKWIIIFSILMILSGLYLCSQHSLPQGGYDLNAIETIYGITLIGYGVIAFGIGKFITWFQKS